MGIENLLTRLDGVKQTAPDRWIAKCPAHDDKRPSLAIRIEPDGRILVHDFGGCSAVDVIGVIGLSFSDLFPEPLTRESLPRIRAPFSALDALKCLTSESSLVAIAASDITCGKSINDCDLERLATAAGRIATALDVIHG